MEIHSAEDAVSLAVDTVSERYGEGFHQVDEVDVIEDPREKDGIVVYSVTLASDSEEHAFSSMVVCSYDSGAPMYDPDDTYQQWVFKPLVERPFAEALEGCAGIDGYAVTLRRNRLDGRVWRAGELEEYMGAGEDGDPMVTVVLLVPPEDDADEVAATVMGAYEALWPLGRSMMLSVGRTGTNPFEEDLYTTDVTKLFSATRGEMPTFDDVLSQVRVGMLFPPTTSWDGTGEVGDPEHVLPQITWVR